MAGLPRAQGLAGARLDCRGFGWCVGAGGARKYFCCAPQTPNPKHQTANPEPQPPNQAIATIKNDRLSDLDSSVTATVVCPSIVVIGEPFWFTYWYEGHVKRLPGAHESDWIGLFLLPESGEEEKGGLVVRLRPPEGMSAEVIMNSWQASRNRLRRVLLKCAGGK